MISRDLQVREVPVDRRGYTSERENDSRYNTPSKKMKPSPINMFRRCPIQQLALLWIVLFLLSSCDTQISSEDESGAAPTLQAAAALISSPKRVNRFEASPTPTSPPAIPPTNTRAPTVLPRSTATYTPSPTATPSNTPTPTATPTPAHPLMIEVLRQQTYPGSALSLESTLAPGSNYDRHIVSYSSEGNKIFALMTVPRGEKPGSGWPVIIFNHGYIPPDQYRTTERYESYVDAFARNGYIVFRSDYRGHGDSEGEAEGGYGSPAYTVDVLNGLAAVKTYADTDAGRIGMWGHSMGGHITLRSMVVSGDVKAGVIWGGVVASYQDLFERWRRPAGSGPTPTPDPTRTRGLWRTNLEETYGSFEENPGFWNAISPNSFVGDLSGPVQLHHGTADTSVPVEFSETLYAQIQAANQPVELYLYQGDNHNISNYFSSAIQRSISFFDTHVKNAN
jgi:fermentation-respiration switch protein FrsA (DUF1100 family)